MDIFNLTNAEDQNYDLLQAGLINWYEYNNMMIMLEFAVWFD